MNKRRIFFLLALLGAAVAHGACGKALPESVPPAQALFYYPTHLAAPLDPVSGDLLGNTVYIVSSNFDQRFDAGWITAVDVPTLRAAAAVPGDSIADVGREAFSRQVRVPPMAGNLALSYDGKKAYLPHRGSGLVTAMNIEPDGSLNCGDPRDKANLVDALQRTDCDRAHLIDLVDMALAENPNTNYRDFQDPYALVSTPPMADKPSYLSIGYLGSPWVSVLSLTEAPTLVANLERNITLGTGTVGKLLAAPTGDGHITGISRKIDTTSDLSVIYDIDIVNSVASGQDLVERSSVNAAAGGLELLGLTYSQDGRYVYVTNRSPDSVVALELLRPPKSGVPGPGRVPTVTVPTRPTLQVRSAVALDNGWLNEIAYLSRPKGDLVVAASLAQDALYFLAPERGALQLVYRLNLRQSPGAGVMGKRRRGPFGVLHVRQGPEVDLLFVTTFFDHGVSVIDVSGAVVTSFKEITHITESPSFGYAPRSR